MRADRLITIVLLLQNRGKMTSKDLAAELEVTERTIHRDMEALSSAGIPVFADRGKSGGFRLLEHYRTNLTGLKDSEIKSLFISPSMDLLHDLGLDKDWHEARQKLIASLPEGFQEDANHVWDRIHVDMSTWRKSTKKSVSFTSLQQGIWDEVKLQINYEKANGDRVDRLVDPLGLVAKGSTWYLIAAGDSGIRSYRVSRIIDATLTAETFLRPADFHLAQYWEGSTQEFIKNLPKYDVQVEISPAIIGRIKFTGRFVQILDLDSPLDDGWIPAHLCFDTETEARDYLLGFGNQVRIIQPKALRQSIYNMAMAVVKAYDGMNLHE